MQLDEWRELECLSGKGLFELHVAVPNPKDPDGPPHQAIYLHKTQEIDTSDGKQTTIGHYRICYLLMPEGTICLAQKTRKEIVVSYREYTAPPSTNPDAVPPSFLMSATERLTEPHAIPFSLDDLYFLIEQAQGSVADVSQAGFDAAHALVRKLLVPGGGGEKVVCAPRYEPC